MSLTNIKPYATKYQKEVLQIHQCKFENLPLCSTFYKNNTEILHS